MCSIQQITNNKNILSIPFDTNIDINKGLAEYILEAINKNLNKIAQVDAATGREQTFGELLERSILLAKGLKKKGITSNDVVNYCCYNNMDYTVTFIATMFLGARINVINVTDSKVAIFRCLKLSTPQIVFCDNEIEDIINEARSELNLNYDIIVYNGSEKFLTFDQFLEKYKSNDEFKINTSRTGNDTACISYTSGTSGLSKAVELKHFGLYYGGMTAFKCTFGEKVIMIFTFPFWISNIVMMLCSLLNGLTRIIYRIYNKDSLCKTLQDYKVNYTILTQTIINELIQNPECCNYDTSQLKYITYGGSPIGINQILQLKKLLPNSTFLNVYAITEVSGLLFQPKNKKWNTSKQKKFINTVGVPIPGFTYKVVDQITGINLGPNKRGELRIKYQGITNGYLNNYQSTQEAFDEDGFFKTGDLVYYDNEYFFYIADRLKEIFKVNGRHISPVIIENELFTNPDVKDAAVIGIPQEEFGEVPMAVVILKENSNIQENELVLFINERLPPIYNLRGGVKFVTSIPKTSTGKNRRNYLRDLILKKQI